MACASNDGWLKMDCKEEKKSLENSEEMQVNAELIKF
jgi:hypothetical protein